jgi:hypothetical protein
MEAGTPRYFHVIFCVIPRYFSRQNDRAQVKLTALLQAADFPRRESRPIVSLRPSRERHRSFLGPQAFEN